MPVESSSPLVMSNQKEVLRCFTVLGECTSRRGHWRARLGSGPLRRVPSLPTRDLTAEAWLGPRAARYEEGLVSSPCSLLLA